MRDLIPYFQSLYGDPSALFYGEDYMLSSEDGCQQGCSLGSMLYVLANSCIVETVIAEFPISSQRKKSMCLRARKVNWA
eukprot:COSAG01_NODE_42881_length_435_cov_1.827381_1_plen_78_part_01